MKKKIYVCLIFYHIFVNFIFSFFYLPVGKKKKSKQESHSFNLSLCFFYLIWAGVFNCFVKIPVFFFPTMIHSNLITFLFFLQPIFYFISTKPLISNLVHFSTRLGYEKKKFERSFFSVFNFNHFIVICGRMKIE